MMMLRFCLMVFLTTLAAPLAAQSPLPADEAFRLEVAREGDTLVATWEIAEGYYLYRDFMGAEDGSGAALPMALPDLWCSGLPQAGPSGSTRRWARTLIARALCTISAAA